MSKVTISFSDRSEEYELDNFTFDQFQMVGERPMYSSGGITERYPIGDPISLITANMPPDLKARIDELIHEYCNH